MQPRLPVESTLAHYNCIVSHGVQISEGHISVSSWNISKIRENKQCEEHEIDSIMSTAIIVLNVALVIEFPEFPLLFTLPASEY